MRVNGVHGFLGFSRNKYPPAKPEVLRLLAPQRGLTAIAKSKPKTEKTTNGRLPELSNFESPPAEPGVYHDQIIIRVPVLPPNSKESNPCPRPNQVSSHRPSKLTQTYT